MTPINWQAYLDGSLTRDELAIADRQLRENSNARAELDALKLFVADIRAAGKSVETRVDSLQARLKIIAAENTPAAPVRQDRRWVFGAVMGAAAFASLAYVTQRNPGATPGDPAFFGGLGPVVQEYRAPDAEAAREWVAKNTGLMVPSMSLANSEFVISKRGKEWACFDFKINGEIYCVHTHRGGEKFDTGRQRKLSNGTTVHCCKGTGWTQAGCCWYISGPDEAVRMQIAEELTNRMQSR